jgi:hypothetical protein
MPWRAVREGLGRGSISTVLKLLHVWQVQVLAEYPAQTSFDAMETVLR